MTTLSINGETRSVAAGNVSDLVVDLQLPPTTLLIEHNGVALLRSEWPTTQLVAGDTVEILRVSAGG